MKEGAVVQYETEKCSHLGARNSGKVPCKTNCQVHWLETLICLSFSALLHPKVRSPGCQQNNISVSCCSYLKPNIVKARYIRKTEENVKPVYVVALKVWRRRKTLEIHTGH